MFQLILLFVLSVVALGFLYGVHVFVLDKFRNLPPGPSPLPFIGNLHYVFTLSGKKMWRLFASLSLKYGPIMTFYFGQYRWIVLTGPKVIHEMLVTQGKVFGSRPTTVLPGMEELRQGVIFCNGEDWIKRRRFCIRTMREFGMGKMSIADRINDEIAHLVGAIDTMGSNPFETRQLLTNAVSNVICSIVFGKRFNYDDQEFIKLLNQLKLVFSQQFSENAEFIVLPALRYFKKPKTSLELLEFERMMLSLVSTHVNDHRKDYNPDNVRDFIDLYIQNENKEDGIAFDAFAIVMLDMFVAGTETTANALNWAFLFMALHPDIQKRCQQVIDEVIGTDRFPNLSDRSGMVYIDAVMYEVLRHASVFPAGALHCNLDEDAKLGGYDIPANSIILFSIAALHRDPAYWVDPDEFNPDRWLDCNGALVSHASHFLPFGLGPRVCLGESLAKAEFFIFLVAILHRFKLELVDKNVDVEKGTSGTTHVPPVYRVTATRR